MALYLGLDIGTVNVKLALIDDGCILHLDTERIATGPTSAVNSLLARLGNGFQLGNIISAGVSGSGKSIIPKELGWSEYSSALAIAAGVLHFHPNARTVIQIGGQSSLIVELEDGLRKPWKVSSNPLCAAGTGRFLEQQAYRLGINLEDLSSLALKYEGIPPRIAARCSVFAKTDLIHLQQKGAPIEAMLYSLCESIARMVASMKKGKFHQPICFVGGVSANMAVAKCLNGVLSTREEHTVKIIVPKNSLHAQAVGAALLSVGKKSTAIFLPRADGRQPYFEMPKLETISSQLSSESHGITDHDIGYLGVDVGSTSTKAVILDKFGMKVLAKNYLMTAGRPIDAVKKVFANLLGHKADRITIAGVGVTGSGRYLVGSFIGADLIKNEITAQARAAAEIDPEADIIEIGGQDSKLIIKRNGIVIDYQMNKACAAGTGSFIDELAESLGISVSNGEFANLAFAAPYTIDLGTRCAAFMGQAVASAVQEAVPLEVITASLSNSIAKNYLSKVVGTRKLGNKVILTGAVFYNQAVVSAFKQQLPNKNIAVAEHKEVSGAIGAALLAKEQMIEQTTKFKGFHEVIGSECALNTFTCKGCDNNCTITRMETSGEKPTFYGSRCDRYDSTLIQAKTVTSFDDREKLLFKDCPENTGAGISVGIPRALLVYDYAPLLIGFLKSLSVNIVLSSKTTKDIMERAVELSYTDTCFPLKLLHGHAATLHKVDHVLYPCVIRLGKKETDQNQKYSCPLVQASPFITRQALSLDSRLLTPIIDFSRGTTEVINNLADIAVKLGFSKNRGKKAAIKGIEAQQNFEREQAALGEKLLAQLRHSNQLGVVIFARSYMSQDSGANLGIAEKLAQLGVVPIPLDFLPLDTIDLRQYSDRPYWFSEAKHIAGAAITASEQRLFGLVLTNFGCGPNSFVLRVVEDIMGNKPLGQLEIDEHAAEAGIVTRLEAFVDTIKGFAYSDRRYGSTIKDIRRESSTVINSQKTLIIPKMAPHAEVIAASMQVCGVKAVVLPEPDERNLLYSNQVTLGTECLPYRVTLGDFIKFHHDNGTGTGDVEGFMAGSYGPCRLGKYAIEQRRILSDIGMNLTIRTTVSNNAYRDLNLGPNFERLAWKGMVTVDYLQRLLWRVRPYEKKPGAADMLFDQYLAQIVACIHRKEHHHEILQRATSDFTSLIDPQLPRRPIIGINGEIYLRSNQFSNCNLVKACEDAGLEVVVSPIGEWIKYISYRNVEDAIRDRKIKKMISGYIKKVVQEHDEHSLGKSCRNLIDSRDPSTEELLRLSSRYLSPRCGSEAVLSIGSGIEWMENSKFAGVISVMPHGCMPGGIVAAMSEVFAIKYHKPWINLTYDGFMETNNLARINDFAEIVKFCCSTT